MHVLIVYQDNIPTPKYGGISRVIWYLGKGLINMGHRVTYLVGKGSTCDFTALKILNPNLSVAVQVPENVDLVHLCQLNGIEQGEFDVPYINSIQINFYDNRQLDVNSVFVSRNHAQRFGSNVFVYNGMDWDDYGSVALDNSRTYFHFLAMAAWSVKNVRGAIRTIKKTPDEILRVLGGHRLNFNMGFRLTLSSRIKFEGMVGGSHKSALMQESKGLLFPVIWHEPFGIVITESLYFGCPVFGTPYGSLSELVNEDVGFLSNDSTELAQALMNVEDYSRKRCHEYARDQFNSSVMTKQYLNLYDRVLNGEQLNPKPPSLVDTEEPRKLPWV